MGLILALEQHIEVMELVYDMAYTKEIKGGKVPNGEKYFPFTNGKPTSL